jgi:hypothetical protein
VPPDVLNQGESAHEQIRILQLHRHQLAAIEAARTGESYVLTTGTGSGKSLAYVIPIVDFVLRNPSIPGIKAIVVYPMNALANSQEQELDKFINRGYPDSRGPVTFARYTGQETDARKKEIVGNPPDILLTNYVMLELLLTRPYDRRLIEHARGLRFLVFDELHTYRGRQGADVAMLIRRVRQACAARSLQCVGTSATLSTEGTRAQQRTAVADMASRLFGAAVTPNRIIGETLRRATDEINASDPEVLARLRDSVSNGAADLPTVFDRFIKHPLPCWIETVLGLTRDDEGNLARAVPLRLSGRDSAAQNLAELIDRDAAHCAEAISKCLMIGYDCRRPDNGFPTFAFRVHQFISRGDSVYASVEAPRDRHVTLRGQLFVPGDRNRVLLPLAFCRECGQEYYLVERFRDEGRDPWRYRGRELRDRSDSNDCVAGFLYRNDDSPWPEAQDDEFFQRIPEDWTEPDRDGRLRVNRDRRRQLPQAVNGRQARRGVGNWHPAPFCVRPVQFLPPLRRRTRWPSQRLRSAVDFGQRGQEHSDHHALPVDDPLAPRRCQLAAGKRERYSVSRTTDKTRRCRPGTSMTSSRSDSSGPPCTMPPSPQGLMAWITVRSRSACSKF